MTTRVLIVFESMFGNTEDLAGAVAEGLTSAGAAVTTEEVGRADQESLDGVDLLVLAAPTHAFSLSRRQTRRDAVSQGADAARADVGLRDWVATLGGSSGDRAERPVVAVFDTRVEKVRRLPGSAARRTARMLRHQGFTVVGEPTSFYVDDVKGPLVVGERDRARDWGAALVGHAARPGRPSSR
jgi:flavodoxin